MLVGGEEEEVFSVGGHGGEEAGAEALELGVLCGGAEDGVGAGVVESAGGTVGAEGHGALGVACVVNGR